MDYGQGRLPSRFPKQVHGINTLNDATAVAHELVRSFLYDVVTLDQTQRCAGGVSQRIQRMTRGVQPGLAHDRLAFMH
jgi:hypothetical protein